jgi:carbonic anhydrase
MSELQHLLDANRSWSQRMTEADPAFFETLARQQTPKYLWIGCSDSRVPANQIVGLLPGEVFVHRNVANLVVHTDLNCLSVLQYAVDVLKVRHVIVCGHYGCGGIEAAERALRLGLVDNWLRHVRDVQDKHGPRLRGIEDETRRRRLCELNVLEQSLNACRTSIVQDAWGRGQELSVHGWCYSLSDGRLRDLGATLTGPADVESLHAQAVERAMSAARSA